MSDESTFSLKRLLVGRPIPSHLAHHERLSRVTGLAVLSSDALSSVAYATDFILATLVVAGVGAFVYAIPISIVIAALLGIVAFSYRQTIHAYPTGGGAEPPRETFDPNAGATADWGSEQPQPAPPTDRPPEAASREKKTCSLMRLKQHATVQA